MNIGFALTVVLAVSIGISLGLLGGGGSILAVPLLVYVAGLPGKEAIATSLLVVGATSAAGLIAHARPGNVRWRTGLLFGFAGMAGAFVGGRLAAFVPDVVLLAGFAVLMVGTAIAMIRGRRSTPGRAVPARELPVVLVTAFGVLVGLVAGMVGAGGGFLVVPALALLGGLAMPAAIGTSLLVIAMQSFAGLAGHLSTTTLHWGLALARHRGRRQRRAGRCQTRPARTARAAAHVVWLACARHGGRDAGPAASRPPRALGGPRRRRADHLRRRCLPDPLPAASRSTLGHNSGLDRAARPKRGSALIPPGVSWFVDETEEL